MTFVNRQRLERERRLTDAIAVPQGAVAAGHHDTLHPSFDGSVQEIIETYHIALKGSIKGEPLGGRLRP